MFFTESFKFHYLNLVYTILVYISLLSTLIPVITGFIWFKTLSTHLRVLFIYGIVCIVTEVLSVLFGDKDLQSYNLVQNIFTFIEFFLFTFIFYKTIGTILASRTILVFAILYVFLTALVLFVSKSPFEQNNILSPAEALILSGCSIYFFYRIDADLHIPRLGEHNLFWLNSAVLIYFGSSFILFLFDGYLEKFGETTFKFLWSLHLLINILYNTLLGIAIWKRK